MSDIVKWLANPNLVASVQRLFGIELMADDDHRVLMKNGASDETFVKNGTMAQYDLKRSVRTIADTENALYQNGGLTNGHHSSAVKNGHAQAKKSYRYFIHNYFFYYFFSFITHMGNEVFYISFLPIMAWNHDDRMMAFVTVQWAFVMYVGQATKDLIKIPRPATPPVAKVEEKYLLEYGFPSTHAMAAMTISYTFMTLLFNHPIIELESNHKLAILSVSLALCSLVCLSRMYLGMHSLLDIVCGLAYSWAISYVLTKYWSSIMYFLESSALNGILAYLFFLFICVVYPSRDRWSSARADTFLIEGVGAGICVGVSFKHAFGINNRGKLGLDSYHLNPDSYQKWTLLVGRAIVGVITVLIVRFASKKLYYTAVRRLNKLDSKTTDKEVKEFIKKSFTREMWFYFFTYSNVSSTVICLCFLVFDVLNIK